MFRAGSMTRIVALIATTFWIAMAYGQSRGEIHGTVLDQNGEPLAAAKVSYDNLDDHRILGGLLRIVKTDAEGKFAFTNLDWGQYAIYPEKEEDDYPNLRFAIYSGGTYQTATVSTANPIANITVRSGPKAAVLHGRISKATDGTPISGRIELSSPGHADRFMATSVPPEYRILIPSDTDVEISFTASGHKSYSIPVHMKSGEESSMDVKLTLEVPTP
jgi:hypothetical protein